MRGGLEELPDRQVAALQVRLMLDDLRFLRVLISDPGRVFGNGPLYPLSGTGDMRAVSGLELGDRVQVGLAVEGPDPLVTDRHGLQDRR